MNLSALWLRLRLATRSIGPVAGSALLVSIAALALLAWTAGARTQEAQQHAAALVRAATPPVAPVVSAQAAANDNLALFYATLGERRYTEQQIKTLFGIAEKTGILLRQGEYKAAYDQNGKLHTYQVTLPVKGSYQAVWQFAMLSLRAIPFAALDDIGFRRDDIGAAGVDARVRFTLYLADDGVGKVGEGAR
ncbi:hypothetical protein [Massilia sp. S19_KUP03_FR1]|uniref:hypothetical protein n=1 Tax=Massilia sp. S19_KUP03_FR1 TaxID=3025503 RepID=UPI002FCD4DBF